jgi:hypothetical protein
LLLAELGLLDETKVQMTWSGLVDEYVEKHCRRGYSRGHLRKLMALVGTCKLPRRVAELQLRRYLTQEKKLCERSGFLRIG